MSDRNSLRKSAFCISITLFILLIFVPSGVFASPKKIQTMATYYCDVDAKGKAHVDFTLLAKTNVTSEQKAALETALGFSLKDKVAKLEDYEEMADEEEEEAEDEYAEDSEPQEKQAPVQ